MKGASIRPGGRQNGGGYLLSTCVEADVCRFTVNGGAYNSNNIRYMKMWGESDIKNSRCIACVDLA